MSGETKTGLNQPHALCKVIRRRNRGIIFLKQEVTYLRCLLDELTKQIIDKKTSARVAETSLSYNEDVPVHHDCTMTEIS